MIGPFVILLGAASVFPLENRALWQNVTYGMTVDQVRALFPAERKRTEHHKTWTELKGFVAVAKCKPEVGIHHPKGVVTHVVVSMPAIGLKSTCTDEAYEAMLSKYGRPDTEQSTDKESITGDSYQHVVS